jgi:hypothetical protein
MCITHQQIRDHITANSIFGRQSAVQLFDVHRVFSSQYFTAVLGSDSHSACPAHSPSALHYVQCVLTQLSLQVAFAIIGWGVIVT